MAKLSRSKELWHIPKRGNINQTVYMVELLSLHKFLNKSWTSNKQETIASEMSKVGLTKSGKALTPQSVRTLLANLPKYLGFIFIDESSKPSRIVVTDIGYELLKENPNVTNQNYKKLSDYSKNKAFIEKSDIVRLQMSKLIITNPVIRNDCIHILVFPFRLTLKLLLELSYLDKEEIAYLLFHTKSEDEYTLLLEKIKNFRSLAPEKRTSEISAYAKTVEGQLTLKKAPSSVYYMYLCSYTGLCQRTTKKVNKIGKTKIPAIKLINPEIAQSILKQFDKSEIYDFKDDLYLWKEYFTNSKRKYPPFSISVNIECNDELLITVEKEDILLYCECIKNSIYTFPAFPYEKYTISIFEFKSSNKIFSDNFIFDFNNRKLRLNIKSTESNAKTKKKIINRDLMYTVSLAKDKVNINNNSSNPSIDEIYENIVDSIYYMFNNIYNYFDKEYYLKLNTLQRITGKNYFDNYRRGGRLEELFFDLLSLAKKNKKIDNVYWFGSLGEFGLARPAPGGKNGYPDIIFFIDDNLFIVELTTIPGKRAQWNSSEAASVPDHIIKYKYEYQSKNVIGIFSAPSIHPQLQKNLTLNAIENNVGIIFINCNEFAQFISKYSREELLLTFLNLSKKQLNQLS